MMLAVAMAILVCWAVIQRAPRTPVGRWLNRTLVEVPVAWLARITRGDATIGFVLAIAAGIIAFVGEGDGIRILTMAAPDVAIWITTFEVSAYLDIVVAIALAASNSRVRAVAMRILDVATRTLSLRRRRRAIRVRKQVDRSSDNDDDRHGTIWAVAA